MCIEFLHSHMKKNLELLGGVVNSQRLLLELARKGMDRQAAYVVVQRNAMLTWQAKHAGAVDADFLRQLLSDPDVARHFKESELRQLCSLDFHFKEVKARFKSVGLSSRK